MKDIEYYSHESKQKGNDFCFIGDLMDDQAIENARFSEMLRHYLHMSDPSQNYQLINREKNGRYKDQYIHYICKDMLTKFYNPQNKSNKKKKSKKK